MFSIIFVLSLEKEVLLIDRDYAGQVEEPMTRSTISMIGDDRMEWKEQHCLRLTPRKQLAEYLGTMFACTSGR